MTLRYSVTCLLVLMLTPAISGAECFVADAADSDISFDFAIERSHFTGHFTEFEVEYCWQDNAPETGLISVLVNMASARTGNKDLDIGMQDKQALNADAFPVATWQTQSIIKQGDKYQAQGELTIRGISQLESGTFRLEPIANNWRLTGQSQLKRLDYKLGIGEFADTAFIPEVVIIKFDFKLKTVD